MFKKPKKITIQFNYEYDGSSGSSTSVPLDAEEMLDHIQYLHDKHGDLLIKGFLNDDTLLITTLGTKLRERVDTKLHKIDKVIKDYIVNDIQLK